MVGGVAMHYQEALYNNQPSQESKSGMGFLEYNEGTQLQQFKKFKIITTGKTRKFVDRKRSTCSFIDTSIVFKSHGICRFQAR